jgi:hypothetical protein
LEERNMTLLPAHLPVSSFNVMPAFESLGSFQVDQASIQEARDMLYAAFTTDLGRGLRLRLRLRLRQMITGDRKRKLDDDEKKERLKAKNRKYYIENKEGLNAYQKRYQAETSAHMTNANQDVSNEVGMKFANIKR